MSEPRPSAVELLQRPDALLTSTHLKELGLSQRAIDAVWRACPVVKFPGYDRPMVRVEHFRAFVDDSTFDGRSKVVPPA